MVLMKKEKSTESYLCNCSKFNLQVLHQKVCVTAQCAEVTGIGRWLR